jgi:hypothetical protein
VLLEAQAFGIEVPKPAKEDSRRELLQAHY